MARASALEEPTVEPAEIVREYGPFPGTPPVNGVSFDGSLVWFAGGKTLQSFDPASGEPVRALDVACDAGTAYDGRHFYQIAHDRIHKVDPATGQILSTIPAPGGGRDSGLTWAEGTLWVGQYRDRQIHQIDPDTGAILRTIESNRFVTGVTWVDGELWHGTWEGDDAEILQLDADTVRFPDGTVSEPSAFKVGGSFTGLTVRAKLEPELAAPSLTVSVIMAVPNWFGAGTSCTVRLAPLPPNEIFPTGRSAGLEDAALTLNSSLRAMR